MRQRVSLDWPPCHYGGRRPWFLCPQCCRRCAILYQSAGDFHCRCCTDLVYPTQHERAADRGLRKEQEIRIRLGGSGSTFEPFPPKPKRMRWVTYHRLWRRSNLGRDAWTERLSYLLERT